MITEDELLVNKFTSVSKDMVGLNCGIFVGGIVEGILDVYEFASDYILKLNLSLSKHDHSLLVYQHILYL